MATFALIDGDIIVWRAATAALSRPSEASGTFQPETFDLNRANSRAFRLVREWTQSAGCRLACICLSDQENNFRKNLEATYKENRKQIVKPEGFQSIREALIERFETHEISGLGSKLNQGIGIGCLF